MKSLVVGISNPHSDDPKDALSPIYPGSAGSRLFQMAREVSPESSRLTEIEYLEGVDRVNLSDDHNNWSREVADKTALNIKENNTERKIVLLGGMVYLAFFRGPIRPYHEWFYSGENYFCVVPHPSGMNRLYNDAQMRYKTGRVILDLVRST